MAEAGRRTEASAGLPPLLRIVAGIVFLGLFAWFVGFMVAVADEATDATWQRLLPIFTTVSTIAAAAAGAAFGNQVQKQRADRAERRADERSKDAERGRALAATLKADAHRGPHAANDPLERLGPRGSDDAVARHARLADELFPDES